MKCNSEGENKVAASMIVYDADKMTDNGRWEIYKWLRRNAEFVLNHGGELSGAYRARYIYQEGEVKSKRAKIKAKAVKVKEKLKGKKAKIAGACAVLLAAALLAGCSSPASRANTQTFDDCFVQVNIFGAANGGVAESEPAYGDILTQNMVVENSGTESTAQPYTVAPNVPVSVPVGAGGGESLAGLIGSILGGGKTAAAGEACADCAEK